MHIWNVLHAAHLKIQDAKKSPSGHQCTNLSGYVFATKACIDNWEKNLLSSNISSTYPHNMANFGPLTAEIVREFGTPQQISFASWLRYCSDVAHRIPTKLCTIFGRLLGWYTMYTFWELLSCNGILPKFTLSRKSCVLLYCQRYCAELEQ